VFELPRAGRIRWLLVDSLAILALMVLVTLAWLPTYGQGWVWVASLGGAVVGLVVAAVAAWRHANAAVTVALAAGAYFLLGTPLAMPSQGIVGVVPSLRSLTGLAVGPVLGWKAMLTIEPPIGETSYLLVPVLLTGLVAALAALTLSLRSGRPTLAWLPPTVALLLAYALGVGTSWQPTLIGLALIALIVIWTAYRRAQQRSALVERTGGIGWSTIAMGTLVLALTGGVAAAASPLMTPTAGRLTVREAVKPPLDIHRYPSPLQGFRLNHTDAKDTVLFTVSGAPQGSRIRIATMDGYDGFTYNVTDVSQQAPDGGAFKRVGERIDDPVIGTSYTVEITIRDYAGVWIPTLGKTTMARFSGARGLTLTDSFYYNEATGTAVTPVGLTRGDTYRLQAVVPVTPSAAEIANASTSASLKLPPAEPTPDVVRDLAGKWGAAGAGAGISSYRDKLKQGYYSNGVLATDAPSQPGHSELRLETLLADTTAMVGDEEQYSVIMALLARGSGVPARVVYGYVTRQPGTAEVKGSDVSAWTEVYLEPYGWVPIDATPPKDRKLTKIPERQQSVPRPQVENPPPPPERPEKNDQDNSPPVQPAPKAPERPPIDWRFVGTVALVGGIPLLTIVVPIALVIGLKLRRRRERRNHADLVTRVSGGWSELVDRARDLGRSPSPSATRTEQADQLIGSFDRVGEAMDPRILARQADATVFAPDTINDMQAATYWTSIDAAIRGLNSSVGLIERLRGSLSVRSFRRFRS
jgi:transglutaminase-like putative cysteine protease